MAGNWLKWLEMLGIAKNSWKWLGNGFDNNDDDDEEQNGLYNSLNVSCYQTNCYQGVRH